MTAEEEIRRLPSECQIAMAKYALAGWEFSPAEDIYDGRSWRVWTPDETYVGDYNSLQEAIRTQGLCGPLP